VEQRVSLITLGVADVAVARAFYERLGWEGKEVEETVFFQAGGLGFVLWGREKLAADGKLEDAGADGFGGVALAHNCRSREEVEEIVATAEAAGARITKRPAETFYGGYAAYFTDPDGHVWEVAHNPGFVLAEDGSLQLPF
jgi:catechol 2,3-dioxygenase-like lactoylglutathione lyase family enzyme